MVHIIGMPNSWALCCHRPNSQNCTLCGCACVVFLQFATCFPPIRHIYTLHFLTGFVSDFYHISFHMSDCLCIAAFLCFSSLPFLHTVPWERKRNRIEIWNKSSWRKNQFTEAANWRKTISQLHSHTKWNFLSLVHDKIKFHMLGLPIICTVIHFQWKCWHNQPQKFSYPDIGHSFSPPSSQEGWGTWLNQTRLFLLLSITQEIAAAFYNWWHTHKMQPTSPEWIWFD